MFRKILRFFDKFEDHTRHQLSRIPLVYAFLAGTGVVIFWRGIWHLADDIGMSSFGSIVFAVIARFVYEFTTSLLIFLEKTAKGNNQKSCTAKNSTTAFTIPLSLTLCKYPKYAKARSNTTKLTKKSVPITETETKRIVEIKSSNSLDSL